jgi:transcriptional regulator with XRE-family HTH domain
MALATMLVNRIKILLKAKGKTYAQLADALSMTEAGVKRAFKQEAFSLKRLEQICTYLNISLDDLMDPDLTARGKSNTLTIEQDRILASDEKLFAFFYLLLSGKSVSKIIANYDYDKKEVDRYLRQLDKVNVITLQPNGQYKARVSQNVAWPTDGLLASLYADQIKADFLQSDFDNEAEQYWMLTGWMSSATLGILTRKMNQLIIELRELIKLDGRFVDDSMKNVTFLAASRPWTLPVINRFKRHSRIGVRKD